MILCRTNAPMFREIMREIRAGRPVRVLSNFLDSFERFVKKHAKGITEISDFRRRIDTWYDKEMQKLDEQGVPKRSNRRRAILDRKETFLCLCEKVDTIDDLLALVTRIANSREGPIFSTIHKSKGLEAPQVHLLRPDLVPPPWVDEEAPAYAQERNLHYVAITRAKLDFTYGVKPE
jgi:ATP-dependent exoDNAse (exonuclease V) beta subunit